MRRRIPWLILVISLAWTGTWAEETYQVRKSGGQLVLTNVTPVGKAGRRTVAQQAAPVAEPAPAASPPRQRPYSHLVQRIASRYGVDANLVHAVIKVESNYDPRAVSRRGAVGLMQLLPSTAAEMGIYQLTDAHDNIMGGVRLLRRLLDRYSGNVTLALAAYNAGPGAVSRHRGVPPYQETQEYVRRVRRLYSGTGRPAVAASPGAIYRYKDAGGAEVYSQFPRSTPPESTVGQRR
jgi:soluble lytic murein transglycosylase-like protein